MRVLLAIFLLNFAFSSKLFASENSCVSVLTDAPYFVLTNEVAIGNISINAFTYYQFKRIVYKKWSYLSDISETDEVLTLVLADDNRLYLVRTTERESKFSRRPVVSKEAWLLSGELDVESFVITQRGYLSVKGSSGGLYTLDTDYTYEIFSNLGNVTLSEFIFGKKMPEAGLLREVKDEKLEKLPLEFILNKLDFYRNS